MTLSFTRLCRAVRQPRLREAVPPDDDTHGAVESGATCGMVGMSSKVPDGRGGSISSLLRACGFCGFRDVMIVVEIGDGITCKWQSSFDGVGAGVWVKIQQIFE